MKLTRSLLNHSFKGFTANWEFCCSGSEIKKKTKRNELDKATTRETKYAWSIGSELSLVQTTASIQLKERDNEAGGGQCYMTYREINQNVTMQNLTSLNTVLETTVTINTQGKFTRSLESFDYSICSISVNLLLRQYTDHSYENSHYFSFG